MSKKEVRCFLGLGIEAADASAIQALLLSQAKHYAVPNLRWVAPHNWHLTLAFLGNQPDTWRAALEEGCRHFVNSSGCDQPLTLHACGMGGFPDAGGRILALLLSDDPALQSLKSGVDDVLRHNGFAPEARLFKPHITLARFQSGKARPLPSQTCDLPLTFTHLTLFQSQPGSDGSEYSPLWAIPLS